MPSTPKRVSRPKQPDIATAVEAELKDAIQIKLALFEESVPEIALAVRIWCDALSRGNKILLCGNGGSAADSQHIATELVVRLQRERRALPAIALTTDTSLLTAAANDFGVDAMFRRQVEALGRRGDLLIAISTSGKSANILAAVKAAKKLGLKVMALTGRKPNPLARLADLTLDVPSKDTQRIQEAHITLLHIICRQTEYCLFGR
jgi:D-sedoheptulose 7-phosphate isomerase